ncbi:unnamed protein product [Pleuronectes platessa]|uniref:Uncharacterized protein n=1 Tax=Pleuronectes platessa TaxID=8262 RepID=A0A9N7TNK5_PLEPL|nr:unnamed protein product [Pleuronectes platessa]
MFIFVVKPLGTCRGWGSRRSIALLSVPPSMCGTGRSSSGGTSRRRRGRRAVGGDWVRAHRHRGAPGPDVETDAQSANIPLSLVNNTLSTHSSGTKLRAMSGLSVVTAMMPLNFSCSPSSCQSTLVLWLWQRLQPRSHKIDGTVNWGCSLLLLMPVQME